MDLAITCVAHVHVSKQHCLNMHTTIQHLQKEEQMFLYSVSSGMLFCTLILAWISLAFFLANTWI